MLWFQKKPASAPPRRAGRYGLALVASLPLVAAPAEAAVASRKQKLAHIVDAENRRLVGDPALLADLSDGSPLVVARAVTALGRIGDPASVRVVVPLLGHGAVSVRRQAAFALGLLGGPEAAAALLSALAREPAWRARASELTALGRAGDETATPVLATALAEAAAPPRVRAAAAEGLGRLWLDHHQPAVLPDGLLTTLTGLAAAGEPAATAAAFALSTFKGKPETLPAGPLLTAFATARSAAAQALLARVLGKLKTPESAAALEAAVSAAPLGPRVESVRALAKHSPALALGGLRAALGDASAQVVVEALTDLPGFGADAATLADQVTKLAGSGVSDWLRASALPALAAIAGEGARPSLDAALKDGPAAVRSGAIQGYGLLATPADLARLAGLSADADLVIAEAALGALAAVPAAKQTPATKAAFRAALDRHDEALTGLVADGAAALQWKDFATDLASAYPLYQGGDRDGVRMSILNALGTLGDQAQLPLVDTALRDPERLVALAAAAAHKALAGDDVSAAVPAASRVDAVTPPLRALAAAIRTRVVLVTSRGDVRLQMLGVAPLTAFNFVKLAAAGLYDGTPFHRIVPHFVAQGGDPRGDGYGGPGYLIREELSEARHLRGTVGMATDGKDTGGSQFFINHGANLHLDGAYTVFARVIDGMDVVDRLEQGDLVLAARVEQD